MFSFARFSLLSVLLLAFSVVGFTSPTPKYETLMITINKAAVPADRISEAVEALNIQDPNTSAYWAQLEVKEYIPYRNDDLYHGVVLAELSYTHERNRKALIEELDNKQEYSVFLDSEVGFFPGVSGSN